MCVISNLMCHFIIFGNRSTQSSIPAYLALYQKLHLHSRSNQGFELRPSATCERRPATCDNDYAQPSLTLELGFRTKILCYLRTQQSRRQQSIAEIPVAVGSSRLQFLIRRQQSLAALIFSIFRGCIHITISFSFSFIDVFRFRFRLLMFSDFDLIFSDFGFVY